MNNKETFPLVIFDFKEEDRNKIYNEIKSDTMLWYGTPKEEFPIEYNWIFELIMKVNHAHFGQNRINILTAPKYSQGDETTIIYGLIRVFVGNFNSFKNQLEVLPFDSVKQLVEKDLEKWQTNYSKTLQEFSNPKKTKDLLATDLQIKIERNPAYKKQFLSTYGDFNEGLETEYNGLVSTSYFRANVFVIFYKECLKRLFPEVQKIVKIDSPPPEQKGLYLGYTDEKLIKLHQKLIDATYLPKNTDSKHFVSAFDGKPLVEGFEPFRFSKVVYLSILLRECLETDSKELKVWKTAEEVFKNTSDSFKNAYKDTDKHKQYTKTITSILKSLQ